MKTLTPIKANDYLDRIDFDPAIIGRTMSTEQIRFQAADLVGAAEKEGLYVFISEMTDALVRIRIKGGTR